MIGFALCHGWGFDTRSMAPLHQAFQQRFPAAEFALFDLGFTGSAQAPMLASGIDWIAVGHSWGFAYLLQQTVVPWKAAIAINGFTRFCRRPGQPEGTPQRVVDAMLARLRQDPRALLQEFRLRCGDKTGIPETLDSERLHDHLVRLRDTSIDLPSCPVLALATQEDLIVSPALARAGFSQANAVTREFAGDHMQLLLNAESAVAAIAEFCEERLWPTR
ncbi:MAG: hypothetical protein HYS18_03480 [Burkholderiales bacterium]|nr:hypothetical protein [Burkholderiales bacterium]